jgi:hypothetical protein
MNCFSSEMPILAALALLAAMARAGVPPRPDSPLAMAMAHEKFTAEAGILLSIEIPYVTSDLRTIPLDDNPGFPQEFMDGLAHEDFHGVDTWPVTVATEGDGRYVFINCENEVFYEVAPAGPYDPSWLFALRGGETLAARMAARGAPARRRLDALERAARLWDPARVVTRWVFVRAVDAADHRVALALERAASPARLARGLGDPEGPLRSGAALDGEGMAVGSIAATGDGVGIAFHVGGVVSAAYADGLPWVAVRHSRVLAPDWWNWAVLTNVPAPAVGEVGAVEVPGALIPGFYDAAPAAHDEFCAFTKHIQETFLGSGVFYTNIVYTCGCVAAPCNNPGFFRLSIPDDGKPFHGIDRLWLARNGVLSAFTNSLVFNPTLGYATSAMPFDEVPGDENGMTFLDYSDNGFDLAALRPPPPPEESLKLQRITIKYGNFPNFPQNLLIFSRQNFKQYTAFNGVRCSDDFEWFVRFTAQKTDPVGMNGCVFYNRPGHPTDNLCGQGQTTMTLD